MKSYSGSATEVVIPQIYNGKSVIAIGARAFNLKVLITSVKLLDGLLSIGNSAINSERDFRKTQQKISNNIENSLQMIA